MSDFNHKAIVVIGHREEITEAHQAATGLFPADGYPEVTPVMLGSNSWASFMVAPDGCGIGGPTYEQAERDRDRFIDWLRSRPDLFLRWTAVMVADADYSGPYLLEDEAAGRPA